MVFSIIPKYCFDYKNILFTVSIHTKVTVHISSLNWGCRLAGRAGPSSFCCKIQNMSWYVSKFRREQRTEFQCPLCGKVGAVEVFQPRLVIFRTGDSTRRYFVTQLVSALSVQALLWQGLLGLSFYDINI